MASTGSKVVILGTGGTIAGVQSVVYGKRRLVLKMRGAAYPALIGPLGVGFDIVLDGTEAIVLPVLFASAILPHLAPNRRAARRLGARAAGQDEARAHRR